MTYRVEYIPFGTGIPSLWGVFGTTNPPPYSKGCIICGEVKEIGDYHKRADAIDGHQNTCKICQRNYRKQWARSNREQNIENARQNREANPRSRDSIERMEAKKRIWRRRNPEKFKASRMVSERVFRGTIKKPTMCVDCLKATPKKNLAGHHEDYSKPLEVEWLCPGCHKLRHREE